MYRRFVFMTCKSHFLIILFSIFLAQSFILQMPEANAARIAIIDSGVDMNHKDLASFQWFNPGEVENNFRDDDKNGYPDDIQGWNFAENNNLIIDYSYSHLYNFEVKKFFEIQQKSIQGVATPSEIAWAREKMQDQDFIKRIRAYANYMHGTHVAGISVNGVENAEIVSVKIIPTEVKLPATDSETESIASEENDEEPMSLGVGLKILKAMMKKLAKEQMKMLEEVATYVGDHQSHIANGSFGTGYTQVQGMVTAIYKTIFRRDPTAEELKELSIAFLQELIGEGRKMIDAAPKTLFVFAAGNEGLNNDTYPSSPTNVTGPNIISVGATQGRTKVASFSNYGAKTVDVLAPGVNILSTVPGDHYLGVSGTSQAAPFVARVAGLVYDMNPELSPASIKDILMKTVDVREKFKKYAVSSGVVNTQRAIRAAQLSKSLSLKESIQMAKEEVGDISMLKGLTRPTQHIEGIVLPLPSTFKISH
jgi:cell wall-associated protease